MNNYKTRDPRAFAMTLISYGDRVQSGKPVPGSELGAIVLRLGELEIKEGGPYSLYPGGTLDQADFGLNLAAAYFLRSCEVHLPRLEAFVGSALAAGKKRSKILDAGLLGSLIKRYEGFVFKEEREKRGAIFDVSEKKMMKLIRSASSKRFKVLKPYLRATSEEIMEKTILGNRDKQMSLMAYYMREALGKRGKQFDEALIAEFGLANIFFWSAFIVYDDFWDEDEAAKPRQIPAANVFARHYSDFFSNADFLKNSRQKKDFRRLFHSIMDGLDTANSWELHFCRMKREGDKLSIPETLPEYGDYTVKYYPAAGHILGPVAMLGTLGYGFHSSEVRNLESYFKHYLVAMQLNDDAHDWKEDLARGNVSTAVSLLMRNWLKHHPERRELDLVSDMPELERLFWFETLTPLCESILLHTKESRRALKRLKSVVKPGVLERFIVRNEESAHKALEERRSSEEFINSFA